MENTAKKKGSNFVVQGSILAIAGILVRLIGMVYRIPLQNKLGDDAMGIYSAAYNIYNIILLLSSYSIPLAVSKMGAATSIPVISEVNKAVKSLPLYTSEDELKKDSMKDINLRLDKNLAFRRDIQPSLVHPNAGSVFKNPDNNSAGRLLDMAGVKEFEFDNVKVWDKHANFIVNKGEATSEDVLEIMVKMFTVVKEKYQIELQPEVLFIGNKTKKEEELCNILYQKTQK